MKSPSGWALANLWYDKYPGVPPRGSPLETVFLLVHLGRREAELLATRALVRGQFAMISKSAESAKAAFEAFQAYADSMFPFLERAAAQTSDHARLMEHIKRPMEIDVRGIQKERAERAKARGLSKFKARREG